MLISLLNLICFGPSLSWSIGSWVIFLVAYGVLGSADGKVGSEFLAWTCGAGPVVFLYGICCDVPGLAKKCALNSR